MGRRSIGLALAFFLIAGLRAQDERIAYEVPEGTVGNQNFGGPLGMDFTVELDLEITQLGVFDSGSDGLAVPIRASVWDREFLEELAVLEFTPEDAGELVGGSRFKALDEPLELPAGFEGTIVAQGYGDTELNGNQGVGPLPGLTTDDGNCAISFIGGGRFGDAAAPLDFPGSVDGGPSNRYAAGTFVYEALEEATPRGGIPFVVPEFTFGNQAFDGVLGNDFVTGACIEISSLGVFDSGSDGLAVPITARLWDTSSGLELASLEFTPDDPGDPIGGSLFKELDEPITLPEGFAGTISAEGYGELEMNGNNLPELGTDNGGCAIRFTGGGRFGNAGEGFPANVDPGPPHRYGTGTFEYDIAADCPERPATPIDVAAEALPCDGEGGRTRISWSPGAGGPDVAGYLVFQTAPVAAQLTPVLLETTSFTVTGLASGVEHLFVVRALPVEGVLASEASEAAAVTPACIEAPDTLFQLVAAPEGAVGNQEFGGALGTEFHTRVTVGVTRLGVFDSEGDGLQPAEGEESRTITAQLWDLSSGGLLVSIDFTTEEPGVLVDGFRYKELEAVLALPAGFQGVVSASGYGPGEPNANETVGPIGLTSDNAGCSLRAIRGRFDANAGVIPAGVQVAGTTTPFGGGSLEYGPLEDLPPPTGGIAFNAPLGSAGNQAFGGALGLDFNVLEDIEITSLGVFDDLSDGLVAPISCRLYNRDSENVLLELDFMPGGDGELVESHVFQELDEPFCLPAGFRGSIVASGYGAGDQNGNFGVAAPAEGAVSNDGGCLVEFVGGGRFGDAGAPGSYPTSIDGGPPQRYLAGTFAFEPAGGECAPLLEPPTGLELVALAGGLELSWLPVEQPTPAESYRVFRAPLGSEDFTQVAEQAEITYLDPVDDGTFCYLVVSVAGGAESDPSSTLCATAGAAGLLDTVAYQVPAGTEGSEASEDAFGLDFNVQLDIVVTHFGVFDDGSNGLDLPIQALLYDREIMELVDVIEFDTEDPGVLVGGFWFLPLDEPIELPAGFQGSIVAEGYGDDERAGVGAPVSLDPGACALEFVGSRRDFPGFFPGLGGPAVAPWATATFAFEQLEELEPTDEAIAYNVPFATVGNQEFGGSLGHDFDVRSDIDVVELGVFDSGSDGLTRPILAQIFDRDTEEELARLEFTPDDAGDPEEGSLFKPLAEPLRLAAGFRGVMVASGYGPGEPNGNQGAVDLGTFTDNGGCQIVFVGGGRFGEPLAPGTFPASRNGGPVDRYAAGTFRYLRPGAEPGTRFIRGDIDLSEAVNITDPVFMLNFLFLGGAAPACDDTADVDDSGTLNITDPVFLLNFLFLGGAPPPAPFPNCGLDPTGDNLDCATFPGCA